MDNECFVCVDKWPTEGSIRYVCDKHSLLSLARAPHQHMCWCGHIHPMNAKRSAVEDKIFKIAEQFPFALQQLEELVKLVREEK